MSNDTFNSLPHIKALFSLLNAGVHINRLSHVELWVDIEKQSEQYQAFFAQLGFDLRIDGRGFAWFHEEECNPNITKQSRQIALLIMVVFDYQADNGLSLGQFTDWNLNRHLLSKVYEKHKALLDAEELDVDGLIKILEVATRKGFVMGDNNCWQFLPSVYRYLAHFEAITEKKESNKSDVESNEEKISC